MVPSRWAGVTCCSKTGRSPRRRRRTPARPTRGRRTRRDRVALGSSVHERGRPSGGRSAAAGDPPSRTQPPDVRHLRRRTRRLLFNLDAQGSRASSARGSFITCRTTTRGSPSSPVRRLRSRAVVATGAARRVRGDLLADRSANLGARRSAGSVSGRTLQLLHRGARRHAPANGRRPRTVDALSGECRGRDEHAVAGERLRRPRRRSRLFLQSGTRRPSARERGRRGRQQDRW